MQDFFNWQGVVGTIAGIIGTVVSIFVLIKSKKIESIIEKDKARLKEKVKIVLKHGGNEEILSEMCRKDITRSEIQGRLGAIPMKVKGKRYSIEFVNSSEFFERIDLISGGSNETKNTRLIIDCEEKEFAQFSFAQLKTEAKKTVKKVKENNGK